MITFQNITKSYHHKTIMNHLSASINVGDKLLLSGPSGSGKTTLFKLILGFEKPDEGSIFINDIEIKKNNLQAIRKQIAYVSQDSDLDTTTLETLLHATFSYKINRHIKDYTDRFLSYCQHFKLDDDVLTKKTTSLSGGERQRAALALALTLDRPVLLLDEVTSGLDADLKDHLITTLSGLNKTILVISHDDAWKRTAIFREVKTLEHL